MLVKTKAVKVIGKMKEQRISNNTQKEYTYLAIYVKDQDGINYTLAYINEFIYNNVEENKDYILVYDLDTKGKIELNGVEIAK